MSATDSSPLRLPVELTDYIIDLLRDDRSSLGKCALVCQAFLPRARTHLFEEVCVYIRQDSEPRWKTLHTLLKETPSLKQYIQSLRIEGEQDNEETWAVLGPDVLGITPDVFTALGVLFIKNTTLPSIEHLIALALSLPLLKRLSCDNVTYANPKEEGYPKNPRWYSCPLALAKPSSPRPVLEGVEFVDSTWIEGSPLYDGFDLLRCFMEAGLHTALEVLSLMARDWPGPSWVPLVQACAPNLHTLMLSFGGQGMDVASTAPPLFDALHELPRLRNLMLQYVAERPIGTAEADDLFVSVFLDGALDLVRGTPVPFPELLVFRLDYDRCRVPDTAQPSYYPVGTEDALQEILRALLADSWEGKEAHRQRRYPCLKRFQFLTSASKELWRNSREEIKRVKEGLVRTSEKAAIRVKCV